MSDYSILSARFASARNDAVVLTTEESGEVAVSQIDSPDVWAKVITWGTPAPFAAPKPPVPDQVALWQARAVLAQKGLFDKADAAVTAANNVDLTAIWQYGNTISRGSPYIATLASALGLSASDVDALFIAANALTA